MSVSHKNQKMTLKKVHKEYEHELVDTRFLVFILFLFINLDYTLTRLNTL